LVCAKDTIARLPDYLTETLAGFSQTLADCKVPEFPFDIRFDNPIPE